MDYCIIAGHGRSGTNWLLELLDLSSQTFCRNEPYGSETSPLRELDEDRFVNRTDQTALDRRWDDAVLWTANHMGERDRPIVVPKDHVYPVSRTLGLYRMVRGPRYRKVLRSILPSLRGGEWRPPSWVFNRARLAEALPVLKLVSSPGWLVYVLKRRPRACVLHIVRHPGGYLNSWANRYRSENDEGMILRLNRARLEVVAQEDPAWADRFGDIARMTTEESELWFWRYATETIDRAGQGKPAYHRIVYEELTSSPVPIVKRCYEDCGLEWSQDIEQAVVSASQVSRGIAAKWRKRLREDQIDLVSRILEGSPMNKCWTE